MSGVICREMVRVSAENLATGECPSLGPTTTPPSGPGVVAWESIRDSRTDAEDRSPLRAVVVLMGRGTVGATFVHRLVGWSRVGGLWVPATIFEAVATLSQTTGVAGEAVGADERLADQIEAVAALPSAQVVAAGSDQAAWYITETAGFARLQFTFGMMSATGANALVRAL